MKKRRYAIASWLFLLFSMLVFAAMVALMFDYVRNQRITREMATALQRIDRLLEDRRYGQAETAIARAADYAGSSLSWLRLIRRSRIAAEATGHYELFSTLSTRAAEALPGNHHLQALALYGDLQTGNYASAGERGAEHLIDVPRYRSLAAEAYLRAGRALRLDQEDHDDIGILTGLGRDSTPAELLQAETITTDLRFRANAAMRALEAGDRAAAETISDDLRFKRHFPLLSAYMRFDTGDFEGFFQNLERVPGEQAADNEVLLMTADVYLIRREYRQAALLYDEILTTATGNATRPPQLFLNRAWISREHFSEDRSAIDTLEQGLGYHPTNWDLRRALAIELAQRQPQSARSLLAAVDNRRRPSAELLRERLFAEPRQVSANVASLWRLVEAYPEDPTVKRFLAWFLAGMPQVGELNRLLVLHPGDNERSDPLAFYRGVSAVASGDLQAAWRSFSVAARDEVDWYAAVNAARIALYLGQSDEAASMVKLARGLLSAMDSSDAQMSTMTALEAALYANQGDFAAAAGSARAALATDGGNLHARTVLRYLETR